MALEAREIGGNIKIDLKKFSSINIDGFCLLENDVISDGEGKQPILVKYICDDCINSFDRKICLEMINKYIEKQRISVTEENFEGLFGKKLDNFIVEVLVYIIENGTTFFSKGENNIGLSDKIAYLYLKFKANNISSYLRKALFIIIKTHSFIISKSKNEVTRLFLAGFPKNYRNPDGTSVAFEILLKDGIKVKAFVDDSQSVDPDAPFKWEHSTTGNTIPLYQVKGWRRLNPGE